MIPDISGILEFILLLVVVTFALRIVAIMTVLLLTILHPERRTWYMELFNLKKDDL